MIVKTLRRDGAWHAIFGGDRPKSSIACEFRRAKYISANMSTNDAPLPLSHAPELLFVKLLSQCQQLAGRSSGSRLAISVYYGLLRSTHPGAQPGDAVSGSAVPAAVGLSAPYYVVWRYAPIPRFRGVRLGFFHTNRTRGAPVVRVVELTFHKPERKT